MLLDLSAAFNTVDHRILLDSLKTDFGISGSALNWIESYLSNKTQRIYIDGVLSSNFNLKFGVSQGSCLGPLLFSLYTGKLFKIVESHLPNPHCYEYEYVVLDIHILVCSGTNIFFQAYIYHAMVHIYHAMVRIYIMKWYEYIY